MSQQVELVPECRISSVGMEERDRVIRLEQRDSRAQELLSDMRSGGNRPLAGVDDPARAPRGKRKRERK